MKNEGKVDKFRFVNPHTLGLMTGFGNKKKLRKDLMESKSRLLADLLRETSMGQIVLVPVNVGYVVNKKLSH